MTKSVIAFLDELKSHKIQTSDFNLPDWKESSKGFNDLLESLFKITLPTAIITDEAYQYIAAQQFFLNKGIRVPQQLSLICSDYAPLFRWCLPTVSHISWNYNVILSRILRWAMNVKSGKLDLQQTSLNATFIEGGTIGPSIN